MPERVAVVAAGAGARGAYEAGALSVLLPELWARGQRPTVFVGEHAAVAAALVQMVSSMVVLLLMAIIHMSKAGSCCHNTNRFLRFRAAAAVLVFRFGCSGAGSLTDTARFGSTADFGSSGFAGRSRRSASSPGDSSRSSISFFISRSPIVRRLT